MSLWPLRSFAATIVLCFVIVSYFFFYKAYCIDSFFCRLFPMSRGGILTSLVDGKEEDLSLNDLGIPHDIQPPKVNASKEQPYPIH